MQLHASCVACDRRGVLIVGSSGSGKSSLALSLMGMGRTLVSDDRTDIALMDGWPVASAPAQLRGVIEARGVGLMAAECIASARLSLVVDMDAVEAQRLPPERTYSLLDQKLPLLHKVESPHFSAAVKQYLLGGKADP